MNDDEILTAQSTALSLALRAQVKTICFECESELVGYHCLVCNPDIAETVAVAVAAERAACAAICDATAEGGVQWRKTIIDYHSHEATEAGTQRDVARGIAARIRYRSKLHEPRGLSASEAPGAAAVTPNPPEVS